MAAMADTEVAMVGIHQEVADMDHSLHARDLQVLETWRKIGASDWHLKNLKQGISLPYNKIPSFNLGKSVINKKHVT